MTCVVGAVGNTGVLLAADSQSSGGNSRRIRLDAKTFQLCDTVAIAACGSARFGQIVTHWLEDYLEEPFPPLGMDEARWAIRVFVPALISALEDHGHLHRYEETSVVELGDSAFLLAIRRRLFTVEPDMQVSEDAVAFSALGSGEEVALGAMHQATKGSKLSLPDEDLIGIAYEAIRASVEQTLYVGGPITKVRTSEFSAEERKLAQGILA